MAGLVLEDMIRVAEQKPLCAVVVFLMMEIRKQTTSAGDVPFGHVTDFLVNDRRTDRSRSCWTVCPAQRAGRALPKREASVTISRLLAIRSILLVF